MTEVDPRTARHLISDQGEVVIDEVRKHWAALTVPVLELAGGVVVALLMVAVPTFWWLPVLLGLGVMCHAAWRILDRRRDRFVITNMRVFRIHGILSEQIATMPLARILDISVYKPFVGRIFGFGHFVFESAAQAQGLREIRYVGDPDERGLTIQRVIQQAGLRGYAGQQPGTERRNPPRDSDRGPRPPLPPLPPLPTSLRPTDRFDPDRTATDPLDLTR
ncbi:MAG TPA: PH domain-containing protein [Microbacterium sp.]|uniref:PH domain-containing protein n=1 Tax=Microbacterium sp. TaxID=51671 RepID=UPI002B463FA0|nr:PH domain-containing protein [Microbacterium sp.]HKT57923.1 PH domain-containing protein [Microbacterium sp.]